MKTLMMSLASLLLLQSCGSQEISSKKVPSVVLNTIKEQYPVTNKVEWKKLKTGYEAEIALNDSTEVSLLVNESGKLVMQKADVTVGEIPAAILSSIQSQYADYTIDDVEKLEAEGNIYYQFELEGKGKKDRNLVFTTQGQEEKKLSYWD